MMVMVLFRITSLSRLVLQSCLLVLPVLSFTARGDATDGADNTATAVEHPECRLFLAESTIPNAGLGIFTGINLQPNEPIVERDIVIPLEDWAWHASENTDYKFLWEDYSWSISEVGMDYDLQDGSALVIGTGCMPNCNFALINAHESKPDYDHAGLHRSKDMGTSGFSGFQNQMITTRDIPAGGEIFASYGQHWFMDRDGMESVPFEDNYMEVDGFLDKFRRKTLKYQTSDNTDFTKDLWDVVASTYADSRNSNALPLSFKEMQLAQAVGAAETRLPYSVKSLEWLNEHGRCMDNIRPDKSTITQAGRGAFATRFIPKGGLVAPGPVLHIANKTSYNLYEEYHQDGITERDTDDQVGMQLMLNYCFGHGQSTVLLCPYTSPSSYINHNSKSPNAKIVWADDVTPNHNPEWLQKDVNFLKTTGRIGLSLNYVATRDIQPGEEVFIDYGTEWEEAWNKYANEWNPPPNAEDYVPAAAMHKDLYTPLRTDIEQKNDPYPNNIVFYCPYDYGPGVAEGPWVWEDEWYDRSDPYPCRLLSREAGEHDEMGNTLYYYTVVMLAADEIEEDMFYTSLTDEHGEAIYIPPGESHIVSNIPRWAIQIRDRRYSKDEFLRKSYSFRHEMMISDEIFPESWKNL